MKENGEALLVAGKDFGLEVNAIKTKYMVMSRDASHESKTSSVSQGYVDSYSTLPLGHVGGGNNFGGIP